MAAFKHVLAWRQKLAGKKEEEEEEEKGEGLLRIFSRHGIGQYDIFNRESHHFIAWLEITSRNSPPLSSYKASPRVSLDSLFIHDQTIGDSLLEQKFRIFREVFYFLLL